MLEMDFVKDYVDRRYDEDSSFEDLADLVIKAKKVFAIIELSKRLSKRKQQEAASTSPFEVEHYYETKLKQYDQEEWI